ncbi:SxtJ family membrane protein [Candidatus Pelagibacter sp.]|nr:SxtJ family membrane protein [Candidatus Pelagibacter sp.]
MQIKNETTNKSFGIVFFIFFLIISIYPLINHGEIRKWSLVLSVIFLALGLINSKILNPLNNMWFKFGILLGKIISPLVMGVIFFFIVTPISIIMKILGKDILSLKKNNKKSYWIKKSNIISKMKNQF